MPVIKMPTEARAKIYKLINDVNRDSKPVYISGELPDKSAALLSQKDYGAQKP